MMMTSLPDCSSPCVAIARDPAILAEIARAQCSLAIWERPAPAALAQLSLEGVGDARFSCPLGQIAEALGGALRASGFPEGPARAALAQDIAALAERFCAILSLGALEVRIEVVSSDSCRKFHADYVSARLITTYVGAGTQWVDQADAQRLSDGLEPRRIRQLAAGDVGLFKGRFASRSPAIHRSPPIAGTGEQRLLVVLNPPPEG